jgi:hypothetical protein
MVTVTPNIHSHTSIEWKYLAWGVASLTGSMSLSRLPGEPTLVHIMVSRLSAYMSAVIRRVCTSRPPNKNTVGG